MCRRTATFVVILPCYFRARISEEMTDTLKREKTVCCILFIHLFVQQVSIKHLSLGNYYITGVKETGLVSALMKHRDWLRRYLLNIHSQVHRVYILNVYLLNIPSKVHGSL